MMKERTLRVLEFTKIRDRLASKAMTEMGRERCEALVPSSNITEIQRMQAETEEATVILQYVGASPLVPFSDVRASLTLAEKGATLSTKALLEVAALMQSARAARKALDTERDNTPILKELAQRLSTLHNVEQDITNAIISEDEIADRASNELMDIRRHLRGANERIKEKLNQMIRSSAFQKYLQDPIVTMRNDRYCLPVKAEYRGSVPGLVHDQSSTGATLFIEPMAAVEMGNELKTWAAKEKQEIERILAALSAEIAPYADQLRETVETLAELDYIFAKGMLSREMNAVSPKLNQNGYINIIRGRHPLIDREKVVPSNLWMGKDFTSLIITGPNTGGKTVTLKTVGLLTLMAMCGLLIPAAEGSRISVFDHVLADIGDTQSIEQNLSTFSAHMHQVISILEQADRHSLVLLDELGSGTDPVEGAALAVAIIDALKAKGAKLMVTTHYQELKLYAIQQPDVENASCEFDIETLKPTYRLIVGSPGKSNAFAISKGLGIPDAIIEEAKGLVSTENRRLEEAISKLEATRTQLEEQLELARQEQAAAKAHEQELEQELEQIRAGKAKQLEQARLQATRILETTTAQSNELLTELEQLRKEKEKASFSAGVTAAKSHSKQKLRKLYDLANPLEERAPSTYQLPRPLRAGDTVRVADTQQTGVVVGKPDQKGSIMVQIGIMKSKMPINRLQLVEQPAAPKQAKRQPAKSTGKVSTKATRKGSMELDIRGNACDEGVYEMEAFLDQAVLSNISTVTIIHGKGTGLLRNAVRQRLKQLSCVKSFRPGVYGEGEDGVTIVTLK